MKRFVGAYGKAVDFTIEYSPKAAEDLRAMVPDADIAEAVAEIKAVAPQVVNEVSAKDGSVAFSAA